MDKRWWRWGMILILPAFFLAAQPTKMADCVLELYIPERIELALSVPAVDLGEPRRVNGRLYYERINAVQVDYRCNIQDDWEVRISADDLRTGTDHPHCPVAMADGRRHIPEYAGKRPVCGVGPQRDHQPRTGLRYSKKISYRLELRGDEWGGTYTAPITYTLFVP